MSSLRLRRVVAVLGLAGWIALVPVAAHAAAEPFQLLPPAGGLFALAWDLIAGLLGVEGTDSSTTTDGAPALEPTVDNGEQGATVDPNGRT